MCPTYDYKCTSPWCDCAAERQLPIDERVSGAPECPACGYRMSLQMAPVAGHVRDPAVPRGKP